jgi:hypothetical protein
MEYQDKLIEVEKRIKLWEELADNYEHDYHMHDYSINRALVYRKCAKELKQILYGDN